MAVEHHYHSSSVGAACREPTCSSTRRNPWSWIVARSLCLSPEFGITRWKECALKLRWGRIHSSLYVQFFSVIEVGAKSFYSYERRLHFCVYLILLNSPYIYIYCTNQINRANSKVVLKKGLKGGNFHGSSEYLDIDDALACVQYYSIKTLTGRRRQLFHQLLKASAARARDRDSPEVSKTSIRI